jgi:hypothetical protein
MGRDAVNEQADDTASALARAVLAGDECAIAGLMDCLQESFTTRPSREWLDLWDRAAREFAAVMMQLPGSDDMWKEYHRKIPEPDTGEYAASVSYTWADALMTERAKRLRNRVKEKK